MLAAKMPCGPAAAAGYLHSKGFQGRLQGAHGVCVAGEAVQQQCAEAGGGGGHWGRLGMD
jgi:hypothetical protein